MGGQFKNYTPGLIEFFFESPIKTSLLRHLLFYILDINAASIQQRFIKINYLISIIDINGMCRDNRCLNDGLCIPHDSGYNCSCKAGYSGQYCESGIEIRFF